MPARALPAGSSPSATLPSILRAIRRCLVVRHPVEASDDDALVGCLAPAVAGAVVDEEGFEPGGLNANAEAHQLVVPGNK